MKKKKLEKMNEKASEVVNTLKANVEILKEKGLDITFIKTLETSVRKMVRLEKELVALKERVSTKKDVLEQERVLTFDLVKDAQKVLKKEIGKEQKPEKEKKDKKKDKKQDPELVEVTEVTEIAEEPK